MRARRSARCARSANSALAPLVLLLREVRELVGERRVDLVAGRLAARARRLHQRLPRPPRHGAGERRAGERLGVRAQRGPVAEPEAERALAVAERQPRAGQRGAGLDAARLQPAGHGLRAERVEAHLLAARGDRREHLARAIGEQQQDHVGAGLLQRLEQRVGRLVVHRVRALEHEHAPRRLERRPRRGADDLLLDVAPQHLVGAARDHPREVRMRAVLHAGARVGLVAGAARQQLGGEGAGRGALAGAGRAVQEVGVRRGAVRRQRRAEDGGGVGVRLQSGEGHGADASPRAAGAAGRTVRRRAALSTAAPRAGTLPSMASLYDDIGGSAAVAVAVDDLYERILADHELAPYFTRVEMRRQKTHMRAFLAAALGGPDIYRGRDMVAAHANLRIERPRLRPRRRPPGRHPARARRRRASRRRDRRARRSAARADRARRGSARRVSD